MSKFFSHTENGLKRIPMVNLDIVMAEAERLRQKWCKEERVGLSLSQTYNSHVINQEIVQVSNSRYFKIVLAVFRNLCAESVLSQLSMYACVKLTIKELFMFVREKLRKSWVVQKHYNLPWINQNAKNKHLFSVGHSFIDTHYNRNDNITTYRTLTLK